MSTTFLNTIQKQNNLNKKVMRYIFKSHTSFNYIPRVMRSWPPAFSRSHKASWPCQGIWQQATGNWLSVNTLSVSQSLHTLRNGDRGPWRGCWQSINGTYKWLSSGWLVASSAQIQRLLMTSTESKFGIQIGAIIRFKRNIIRRQERLVKDWLIKIE